MEVDLSNVDQNQEVCRNVEYDIGSLIVLTNASVEKLTVLVEGVDAFITLLAMSRVWFKFDHAAVAYVVILS